mmetsp:Transcript_17507/g.52285  ORF Transcript_17507/g.52285 Transcript_17507/m.52285 type:complete len:272 (-) Transcript_17507:232-1047(-)
MHHVRQAGDDRAKEDRRNEHDEDGEKPRRRLQRVDVTVADCAHRHEHPIDVLDVIVPPRGLAVGHAVEAARQAPRAGNDVCEHEDDEEDLRDQDAPVEFVFLLQPPEVLHEAAEPRQLQQEQRRRRARRQHRGPDREDVQDEPTPEVSHRDQLGLGHQRVVVVECGAEVDGDVEDPDDVSRQDHGARDARPQALLVEVHEAYGHYERHERSHANDQHVPELAEGRGWAEDAQGVGPVPERVELAEALRLPRARRLVRGSPQLQRPVHPSAS